MNRSILIVICDFLLVSLLAFSNVDVNNISREGKTQAFGLQQVAPTNPPSAGNDLTSAMKLALEEEQKQRQQLRAELTQTREQIGERETRVQNLQQQLQTREQQAQQLQQQQAALAQQFAAAQTNISALNQKLQHTSTEAVLTKEQLAAMEAEAKKRAEEASALQKQLADLASSNQAIMNERQQLSTQLQVAQVESRAAKEQVALMSEQVKAEREQQLKLAEGVKALATNSVQLAQEIRENRPLAPNTIFNDYVSNRVEANIAASRPGIFGEANKHRDTQTVLVTDGTNTFALCHVQDTPLTLWDPGTDWSQLTGSLAHGAASVPIQSLSFSFRDPRVVWMPVSADDAKSLGCKIYRTSADPFKFQDAVLVGGDGTYYGECKFQMDLSTPNYVKLDNSFIKGLFGKFNPSRGDLVFSKTGELLGIMANGTYCLVARNFEPGATIRFGNDIRAEHTGQILSGLYAQVFNMPQKLQ
jgi:hypothetical protein